jgi:hypothetical protein
MLPVKQYVIDLIDSRVESFDLRQQMGDYIARQATKSCDGGKVKREEVGLCHFLMPSAGSLGDRNRNTGGRIEAIPAAIRALGSVTPAAAIEITATKKALAQDPAAVFSSFIRCS